MRTQTPEPHPLCVLATRRLLRTYYRSIGPSINSITSTTPVLGSLETNLRIGNDGLLTEDSIDIDRNKGFSKSFASGATFQKQQFMQNYQLL